ncbi:MAG: hypothetical protein RIB45_04365 [Marivibrio sp.]|uniref:hypothetical protein n=1 Tax=Marivibrio sp. TaxID=2039719 RepID=UPI0032EDD6C4
MEQFPQTASPSGGPTGEGLSAIAEGLLTLSPAERHELDRIITPRVASLLSKAFGPEFYTMLRPLTENDGPDGLPTTPGPADPRAAGEPMADPTAGRHPDEESLRRLMRDPRYWRDKDPAVVDQVSQGFRRLYG